MNDNKSLISTGAGIAKRNLRYIVWFYLLNLVFAWFGASGLGTRAHNIMDHSGYSDKVLHGFDLAVFDRIDQPPRFRAHEEFHDARDAFRSSVLVGEPHVHAGRAARLFLGPPHFARRVLSRLRPQPVAVCALVRYGRLWSRGRWQWSVWLPRMRWSTAADKTNYERLPFFTRGGRLGGYFSGVDHGANLV